jgi:uncharacterized protein (DUF58 family)
MTTSIADGTRSVPATAQALADGQQAGSRYALSAPRLSPQGSSGTQLSRSVGESLEFMDYREYQPGDDLRRLDWAASARSDKLIVKLYRQEVCPHLDILLDGSRSMGLRGTEKARAAVGLAAELAAAADNAGYSRRVYLSGQGCRPVGQGAEPPMVWRGLKFDSAEGPAESLHALPPAWRPHGMRVFISDLLWLGDPLDLLRGVADRASAVYVVQVLAAADADPSQLGNFRLVDSETNEFEELFLDATALARYRRNLERHCDNWHRAARQLGGQFVPLVAERLVAEWDFSALLEAGILTV